MDKIRHLIVNTDQVKQFVRMNASVLKTSFLPYEPEAREKYLVKYLGETLHDQLLDYANEEKLPAFIDTAYKTDLFKNLCYLSQAVTAKFTLYIASPHLDLHLSEQGFIVTMNQNSAPASTARVEASTKALFEQGYSAIEALLNFLEKHNELIESYKDSKAHVLSKKNFITTTADFEQYVRINGSRYRFIEEIQPEMDNVEITKIEPLISTALANKLKKDRSSLPPKAADFYDIIKRAIANTVEATLTDGQKEPRKKETLTFYSNHYLAMIKQHLDDNAQDYPEYRASTVYVNRHTYSHHDNTDTKMFVFGGN